MQKCKRWCSDSRTNRFLTFSDLSEDVDGSDDVEIKLEIYSSEKLEAVT